MTSRLREIAEKSADPASFKPVRVPGDSSLDYKDDALAAQPAPGSLKQAECCVPFVVQKS